MKKGNLILLLLVVLLGALVVWLKQKPSSNSSHSAEAFAIKDTASITRIFMANKRGGKVLLERKSDNTWEVNGKVKADESKVNLLLSTLHDLQVKMPVAESMHNTAMGILGSAGIKCEVFAGEELLKTIYVGSETPDKEGTFMILEGEDQPYIIQQPGFIGFLTPRFHTSEVKWQSKLIFNAPFETIEEVRITYPKNPSESFTLNKTTFAMKGILLDGTNTMLKTDTQAVKVFLNSFTNLYAEGFYEEEVFTLKERDSLFKLISYCTIELKSLSGNQQKVVFYEKPIGDKTKDRYDDNREERSIDPEKFFVKLEGTPLVASVQEYAFRRVLKKKSELLKQY